MKEIDDLKAKGKHEEAGARASFLGLERQCGCHFGMKSNREASIAAFYHGYDKMEVAKKFVKESVR